MPSFLGMEGGQQQHPSEHSDGCEQQTIYCSHHPIMKNIGSHDRSFLTPRAPLTGAQLTSVQSTRVAGGHKGGTRIRFTREGHHSLGNSSARFHESTFESATVFAAASG